MYQVGASFYQEQAEELKSQYGLRKQQYEYYINTIKPKDGQELAFDSAFVFTEKFLSEQKTKGILLVGGVGSGKTHIAASIVNSIANYQICEEYHSLTFADIQFGANIKYGHKDWMSDSNLIIFTSVVDMLDNLKENWGLKELRKYQTCNLLVLDDFGTERPTEWALETLFKIVDYRYNEELPMIITTNYTPKDLKNHVGDRIFDRIRSMCALVPVTSESNRQSAQVERMDESVRTSLNRLIDKLNQQ